MSTDEPVDEQPSAPSRAPEGPRRTTYLARYEEFEAALVLDILSDAGIAAFPKVPLDQTEAQPYGMVLSDRGVIMVDADRLDEAERIVAEQLPQHLEAIAASMDEVDVGEPEAEESSEG